MKQYSTDLQQQQRKTARELDLVTRPIMMAKFYVLIASSNKHSPKFTGSYKVIKMREKINIKFTF